MALIGISKFETEDYVSKLDPSRVVFPEDHPSKAGELDATSSESNGATVFVLGALDIEERAFITDKTSIAQEDNQEGGTRLVFRPGSRNLWSVRLGLKAWRNFQDENSHGIKINFTTYILNGVEKKIVANDSLAQLGLALITELGEQILEKNNFLQAVAKN